MLSLCPLWHLQRLEEFPFLHKLTAVVSRIMLDNAISRREKHCPHVYSFISKKNLSQKSLSILPFQSHWPGRGPTSMLKHLTVHYLAQGGDHFPAHICSWAEVPLKLRFSRKEEMRQWKWQLGQGLVMPTVLVFKGPRSKVLNLNIEFDV